MCSILYWLSGDALRLHERGPPSQHRRKLAYGLRMTQFRCRFGNAKVLIFSNLSKFALDLTTSLLFIEITFFDVVHHFFFIVYHTKIKFGSLNLITYWIIIK